MIAAGYSRACLHLFIFHFVLIRFICNSFSVGNFRSFLGWNSMQKTKQRRLEYSHFTLNINHRKIKLGRAIWGLNLPMSPALVCRATACSTSHSHIDVLGRATFAMSQPIHRSIMPPFQRKQNKILFTTARKFQRPKNIGQISIFAQEKNTKHTNWECVIKLRFSSTKNHQIVQT